jgi:hypothetical protein
MIILAFAQVATRARAKRDTSKVEWPIHSNKASSSNITREDVASRRIPIYCRTRSSRGRRVTPLDGDKSGN